MIGIPKLEEMIFGIEMKIAAFGLIWLIKQKILSTQMTICDSNCARFMMMHALV